MLHTTGAARPQRERRPTRTGPCRRPAHRRPLRPLRRLPLRRRPRRRRHRRRRSPRLRRRLRRSPRQRVEIAQCREGSRPAAARSGSPAASGTRSGGARFAEIRRDSSETRPRFVRDSARGLLQRVARDLVARDDALDADSAPHARLEGDMHHHLRQGKGRSLLHTHEVVGQGPGSPRGSTSRQAGAPRHSMCKAQSAWASGV